MSRRFQNYIATFGFDQPDGRILKSYSRQVDPVRYGDQPADIVGICEPALGEAVRIQLLGPDGVVYETAKIKPVQHTVSAGRETVVYDEYRATIDFGQIPEGHYILTSTSSAAIRAMAVIVGSPQPYDGQLIPVCPWNFRLDWQYATQDRDDPAPVEPFQRNRFVWVPYLPDILEHDAAYPVAPGVPYSDRNVPKWGDDMVGMSTRSSLVRRWNVLPDGVITVSPYQTYHFQHHTSLRLPVIEGDYCSNALGHVVSGEVQDDGSCLLTISQGAVMRVDLDKRAHLLFGWHSPWHVFPRQDDTIRRNEEDWYRSHYQVKGNIVGTDLLPGRLFDCIHDPLRPGIYYAADVDQHIVWRYDASTNDLTVLAGDGTIGAEDGHDGRLETPWGLAIIDDVLYVSEDHGSAIRTVKPDTGEVGTLVRSAMRMPHEKMTEIVRFEGIQALRDMTRDGAFGEAVFMHPQGMRADSEGHLIIGCHHEMTLRKVDLQAGTVTKICDIQEADNTSWAKVRDGKISLAVDRWGASGPVDDMIVACWFNGSSARYSKTGERITGFPGGRFLADYAMNTGPRSHCRHLNYPWMAAFGADGSTWLGQTSGEGVQRFIQRPDGTPDLNWDLYYRGEKLWRKWLALEYGEFGRDHLRGLHLEDVPPEAMRETLAARLPADDGWGNTPTDADLDALEYWGLWNTHAGRQHLAGIEPAPQPEPEPGEDPEPVPDPDDEDPPIDPDPEPEPDPDETPGGEEPLPDEPTAPTREEALAALAVVREYLER